MGSRVLLSCCVYDIPRPELSEALLALTSLLTDLLLARISVCCKNESLLVVCVEFDCEIVVRIDFVGVLKNARVLMWVSEQRRKRQRMNE